MSFLNEILPSRRRPGVSGNSVSRFLTAACVAIFAVVVVGRVSTPIVVAAGDPGIVSVTAGGDFGCVVLDDSTVKCWGDNSSGQLGHSTLNSTIPLRVSGLTGVVS